MKLRFLGTGTSFGIPVIGCNCDTCTSTDPRDRRTRHGALLFTRVPERTILIDTPPELRLQLIAAGVSHIDAVWFTHGHADHTHGIDDLRIFTDRGGRLPTYADHANAAFLRDKFPYIFDESYLPVGGPKVNLDLREFGDSESVDVAGVEFAPLPVPHGDVTVYGFRVGNLGYITDAKRIPSDTERRLAGVTTLVLNALWFGRSHPTHFNIEEAIEIARRIGARRTYLTHLTHRVRHAELIERLPPGITAAYDGLEITIDEA